LVLKPLLLTAAARKRRVGKEEILQYKGYIQISLGYQGI
jgi:hypothetical protein